MTAKEKIAQLESVQRVRVFREQEIEEDEAYFLESTLTFRANQEAMNIYVSRIELVFRENGLEEIKYWTPEDDYRNDEPNRVRHIDRAFYFMQDAWMDTQIQVSDNGFLMLFTPYSVFATLDFSDEFSIEESIDVVKICPGGKLIDIIGNHFILRDKERNFKVIPFDIATDYSIGRINMTIGEENS